MIEIAHITPAEILQRYHTILLDAFGVLIHQQEAIPGAIDFIRELNRAGKDYYVLTNDAANSLTTSVRRFTDLGFAIEPYRIITSGSLLVAYFQDNNLRGHGCVVLGPQDSIDYVIQAGGNIVALDQYRNWDTLVVCDEMGYPFLETLDLLLSMLIHKLDLQESIHLVLPNPDLIYRKNQNCFGITAGSIALVLENALQLRYPRRNIVFTRLGKPYLPIFKEAYRRSGTRDMVMIGDQLVYDIRGAKEFGIPGILIGTGINKIETIEPDTEDWPDYILSSWQA